MRLIDADKLKRHYAWWGSENANGELKERKTDFDVIVDLQPTVEAEPIRHGHWIPHKTMFRTPIGTNYDCSVCGEESFYTKYCPNCGAIMDKEIK